MNKLLSLLAPLFLAPLLSLGQDTEYKILFDLTDKDPAVHQMVVRWINQITKETPNAQLEVVFYGQSLDMVRHDKSTTAGDVATLARNNNVSFVVCELAMKRHNIDKSHLLPGIKTVPNGIYQLVSRQKEGWGYIKITK